MNTRKFPRTTDEAFPHTASYACSIHHHSRYLFGTWPRIAAASLLLLLLMYGVGCAYPTKLLGLP
jgi:hypothetical protein